MLPARNLRTAYSFKKLAVPVAIAIVVGVFGLRPLIANAAQPIDLGTADSFAVLAGQGVTNTDSTTVINGNLGTSPLFAVTGFPPGVVIGEVHQADEVALQAQTDLTAAYNDAASRQPVTTIGVELGGEVLVPGVYDSLAGYFEITGTLTLDATSDPDGIFVFKMASTLVTASYSNVVVLGGAGSCSIFWQVGSSATLGTYSAIVGNVLALTSIQAQTSAEVNGRLLARNASVTLDDVDVTATTCVAASPSPSGP